MQSLKLSLLLALCVLEHWPESCSKMKAIDNKPFYNYIQ